MDTNKHVQDGLLQQRVLGYDACKARCDGTGLQTGISCYGFDLNTMDNACYIFTNSQFNPLMSMTGVNHYRLRGCIANVQGRAPSPYPPH